MTNQPSLDQLAEQAGAWEWLRGWKGVRFDDCRCGDQYCPSCSFVAMIHRVAAAATQAQREHSAGEALYMALAKRVIGAVLSYAKPDEIDVELIVHRLGRGLEAQREQSERLATYAEEADARVKARDAEILRLTEAVLAERDERFTEADVRALMAKAWCDGNDAWRLRRMAEPMLAIERLLAEHKAQQKASVTP